MANNSQGQGHMSIGSQFTFGVIEYGLLPREQHATRLYTLNCQRQIILSIYVSAWIEKRETY